MSQISLLLSSKLTHLHQLWQRKHKQSSPGMKLLSSRIIDDSNNPWKCCERKNFYRWHEITFAAKLDISLVRKTFSASHNSQEFNYFDIIERFVSSTQPFLRVSLNCSIRHTIDIWLATLILKFVVFCVAIQKSFALIAIKIFIWATLDCVRLITVAKI